MTSIITYVSTSTTPSLRISICLTYIIPSYIVRILPLFAYTGLWGLLYPSNSHVYAQGCAEVKMGPYGEIGDEGPPTSNSLPLPLDTTDTHFNHRLEPPLLPKSWTHPLARIPPAPVPPLTCSSAYPSYSFLVD